MYLNDEERRLKEVLKIHYCDASNTEKHGSILAESVKDYFQKQDFKSNVKTFKALSNSNRLGILVLLTFREMCVCELAAALELTQPNLSHHIRVLENAGIVSSRKEGKWVYYKITEPNKFEQLGIIK